MSEHEHHIISFETYLKVFVALIGLTILTVAAPMVNLGWMDTPIALIIATIKAVLVMLWFMHLKYEDMTNRVFFYSSFAFLFLLLLFSLVDIWTRIPEFSTL